MTMSTSYIEIMVLRNVRPIATLPFVFDKKSLHTIDFFYTLIW